MISLTPIVPPNPSDYNATGTYSTRMKFFFFVVYPVMLSIPRPETDCLSRDEKLPCRPQPFHPVMKILLDLVGKSERA
jgi:hypothetical protein